MRVGKLFMEPKLANSPLCEECLRQDRSSAVKKIHHMLDIDDNPTRFGNTS